jgi:hypothetical protein
MGRLTYGLVDADFPAENGTPFEDLEGSRLAQGHGYSPSA